jgi:hypothetical protein
LGVELLLCEVDHLRNLTKVIRSDVTPANTVFAR